MRDHEEAHPPYSPEGCCIRRPPDMGGLVISTKCAPLRLFRPKRLGCVSSGAGLPATGLARIFLAAQWWSRLRTLRLHEMHHNLARASRALCETLQVLFTLASWSNWFDFHLRRLFAERLDKAPMVQLYVCRKQEQAFGSERLEIASSPYRIPILTFRELRPKLLECIGIQNRQAVTVPSFPVAFKSLLTTLHALTRPSFRLRLTFSVIVGSDLFVGTMLKSQPPTSSA